MRRFTSSVPVWVRVPAIIALVLLAVLISTTWLNAAGVGARGAEHGSADMTQMADHMSDAGGHGSDGVHGSSDVTPPMDHTGGGGGHGGTIATPAAR
jgi:hypothetical protein